MWPPAIFFVVQTEKETIFCVFWGKRGQPGNPVRSLCSVKFAEGSQFLGTATEGVHGTIKGVERGINNNNNFFSLLVQK